MAGKHSGSKNQKGKKARGRGEPEAGREDKTNPATGEGRAKRHGGGSRQGQARRGGNAARGGRNHSFAAALSRSARSHPAAAVAIGAGVGLLLAQGARMAWSSAALEALRDEVDERGGYGSLLRDGAEFVRDEAATLGRYGRRGISRIGEALGEGASSIGETAHEGYERGRELAAETWQDHPLAMCATALVLGAAAGLLLPSLPAEVAAIGEASARAATRLKEGAGRALEQGKEFVSKAADTAAREADRAGLTPEKLGRKVKRLATSVRETVTATS